MQTGTGEIVEIYLEPFGAAARIRCPANLVPSPGQYIMADQPEELQAALAVPVFNAGTVLDGFLAAPPLPVTWLPGTQLSLRGPLGHGFAVPTSSHRIALASLGETAARLLGLIPKALERNASVTLVCSHPPAGIPAEVEIQPVNALPEIAAWADFLAIDLPRSDLPELQVSLRLLNARESQIDYAQVLVLTDIPCAGMGECGVCAVNTNRKWKLACKHGPVFKLNELF